MVIAIIKHLRDDDQHVRRASVDALAKLAKFSKTVYLTKIFTS